MQGSMEDIGRSVYLATCFVAVAGLGFVAGSVATLSEAGPARIVEHAYRAGTALYSKATQYSDPLQFDLWRPARTDQQGVTRYDPSKADNGLTLYTSGHDQKARLIDMQGRVVREWGVPVQPALGQVGGGQEPAARLARLYREDPPLSQWRPAGALRRGRRHALGLRPRQVRPEQQRPVEVSGHVHHDLTVAPDGRIFVLTQEIGQDDLPQYAHLKAPRIDDYIVGAVAGRARAEEGPADRQPAALALCAAGRHGAVVHPEGRRRLPAHQLGRVSWTAPARRSCPRRRRAGCCSRSARSARSPSSTR